MHCGSGYHPLIIPAKPEVPHQPPHQPSDQPSHQPQLYRTFYFLIKIFHMVEETISIILVSLSMILERWLIKCTNLKFIIRVKLNRQDPVVDVLTMVPPINAQSEKDSKVFQAHYFCCCGPRSNKKISCVLCLN